MNNSKLKRKPILVEFDEFKNKNVIRNQTLIENPLAGNIKLSNGEHTLNIYFTQHGPEVYYTDKKGNIKLLR